MSKLQQKWTIEQQNEINNIEATLKSMIFNLHTQIVHLKDQNETLQRQINKCVEKLNQDVEMKEYKIENKEEQQNQQNKTQEEDIQKKLRFLYDKLVEQQKQGETHQQQIESLKKERKRRIAKKMKKKVSSSENREMNRVLAENYFSRDQQNKISKLETKTEITEQQEIKLKHTKLSMKTQLRRELDKEIQNLKTELNMNMTTKLTELKLENQNRSQKLEGDINSLISNNELLISQKELILKNKIKNEKEDLLRIIATKMDQQDYYFKMNQQINSLRTEMLDRTKQLINQEIQAINKKIEENVSQVQFTEYKRQMQQTEITTNTKYKSLEEITNNLKEDLNKKPNQQRIEEIKKKILEEDKKILQTLNDKLKMQEQENQKMIETKIKEYEEKWQNEIQEKTKKLSSTRKELMQAKEIKEMINNNRKELENKITNLTKDNEEIRQLINQLDDRYLQCKEELTGKHNWIKTNVEQNTKELKSMIKKVEGKNEDLEQMLNVTTNDTKEKCMKEIQNMRTDTEQSKKELKDFFTEEIKASEKNLNNTFYKLKEEYSQHIQEVIETAKSSKKRKAKNKQLKKDSKIEEKTQQTQVINGLVQEFKQSLDTIKDKINKIEATKDKKLEEENINHCCKWCTEKIQEIEQEMQDMKQTLAARELLEEIEQDKNSEIDQLEKLKEDVKEKKSERENNKCCEWCTQAITELDQIIQQKVYELKDYAVEIAENFTKEAASKYKIMEEIIDDLINEHRKQVKDFLENMERKCEEIYEKKFIENTSKWKQENQTQQNDKKSEKSYKPKLNILNLQKYKLDPSKREYAIKRQLIEYNLAKTDFNRTDIKFPELTEDQWEALNISEKIIILNLNELVTENDVEVLVKEIRNTPRITGKEEIINKLIKSISKFNPKISPKNLINEDMLKMAQQINEMQEKINLLSARKVEAGKTIIDSEYKKEHNMYNDRVLVLAKECMDNKNLRNFNKKSYAEYMVINEITQKVCKKKYNLIYDSEWEAKSLTEKFFWTNTNVIETSEDIIRLGEIIDKFEFKNKETMKQSLLKLYEKYYLGQTKETLKLESKKAENTAKELNEENITQYDMDNRTLINGEKESKNLNNKIRIYTTDEDYIEYDKEYVDYAEDLITYNLKDKEVKMLKEFEAYDDQLNEEFRKAQERYEKREGISKEDWYPHQEYNEQIEQSSDIYYKVVKDSETLNFLENKANLSNDKRKKHANQDLVKEEYGHHENYNRNYKSNFNNNYKISNYNKNRTRKQYVYKPITYTKYRSNKMNRNNRSKFYTNQSLRKYKPRNKTHECIWLWEDEQAGSIYCKYCQKYKNPRYEGNF